jgi:class 3 adenylate cyclase
MSFSPDFWKQLLAAQAGTPLSPKQYPTVPAPSMSSLLEALAKHRPAVATAGPVLPKIPGMGVPHQAPTAKTSTGFVPSVLACQGLLKILSAKRHVAITDGRVLPSLDALAIGTGRQLRAAFVYADLDGFSKTVASQPKELSLFLLMSFFEIMSRITAHYGGTVVDCAGDRTLSVFYRPAKNLSPDPAREAATCALWMQTIMQRVLAPAFAGIGIPALGVGIGVDHGDAVVGCVGLRNNKRFIFLGEPANNAAKLQEIAAANETVFSEVAFVPASGRFDPRNGWSVSRGVDMNGRTIYRTFSRFANSVVEPPRV